MCPRHIESKSFPSDSYFRKDCIYDLLNKRQRKDSGLTSVGVRINESELVVRSRGSRTISMKCLGHEAQRGNVQYVHGIAAVPISLSLVTQAGLLENLHRLDTMIVEKVARKVQTHHHQAGGDFCGAPYSTRTSRAVGAVGTPWSSGKVASPCSRVALVRVPSQRSTAASSDGKSELRQGR